MILIFFIFQDGSRFRDNTGPRLVFTLSVKSQLNPETSTERLIKQIKQLFELLYYKENGTVRPLKVWSI